MWSSLHLDSMTTVGWSCPAQFPFCNFSDKTSPTMLQLIHKVHLLKWMDMPCPSALLSFVRAGMDKSSRRKGSWKDFSWPSCSCQFCLRSGHTTWQGQRHRCEAQLHQWETQNKEVPVFPNPSFTTWVCSFICRHLLLQSSSTCSPICANIFVSKYFPSLSDFFPLSQPAPHTDPHVSALPPVLFSFYCLQQGKEIQPEKRSVDIHNPVRTHSMY